MTESEIFELLSNVEDSRTQKKISEIVTIEKIVNDDNLLKLRLKAEDLLPEEKKELRKLIEATFADKGKDVLVTIVTENNIKPTPIDNSQIKPFISKEILNIFKKRIAVYSTKGGVGKSTVAVELALEMSQKGLKVALVDLDIYGPSVPRILGLKGKIVINDEKFIPAEIDGIHMMSVGLLLPSVDSPLIWRAPIVNGVIAQIFTDTKWDDEYDVLIIDMPPGTGDIPIVIGQSLELDGILSVTTPQGVAMEDTIKGLSMFRKFNVSDLGFVYNMGFVACPNCDTVIPIFPKSNEFDELLMEYEIDVLAELPLDVLVSQLADTGELRDLSSDSLWKKEFSKITNSVIKSIGFF